MKPSGGHPRPAGIILILALALLFCCPAASLPEVPADALVPEVLRRELPGLLLSMLCILLGLFVMAGALYFRLRLKIRGVSLYLGPCSILLGLWRASRLESISLLLAKDAAASGSGLSLLNCCLAAFIVLMLAVFLHGILASIRRAYTDSRTGLENRSRWNELMNSSTALQGPCAILVIDLNGLKQANDTLGHDAGDRVIDALSRMLRHTLPRNSVICRWGGDEFTVLLTGLTREALDGHIAALERAREAHNAAHPELPIHFALGASYSPDHPGAAASDLFRLADKDMYRDKRHWYAQDPTE